MLANFAMFGILLGTDNPSRPRGYPVGAPIRAATVRERSSGPFRLPLTVAGGFFAVAAAVIVGKAAYIEVVRGGPTIGAGTLVVQADGGRRYQYNPRLQEIMTLAFIYLLNLPPL